MKTIKTSYSQFLPSALLEDLRNHYDLPTDAVCKFFKSGLNDIYKITAQNDTYYHLDTYYGAYRRLAILANEKAELHLLE